VAAIEAAEAAADFEEISEPQGKCTRLHAQVADKNAKFLSNQRMEGQYFVKTVTQRTNQECN
jgi:hypothetical protein